MDDDWMTPEEKTLIIPKIMRAIPKLNEDFSTNVKIKEELTRVKKPKYTYETGSTYEGEWDAFGMSGKGVFKMFNGVYYVGEMEDGMFHGKGTVWYPCCSRLEGVWNKGNMQEDSTRQIVYNDNLTFTQNEWGYCTGDDRRFLQERRFGINPGGRSLLSASVAPKQTPPGCYDTGDGYYNPLTKCVYNALGEIVRIPKRSEEIFIMDNYRKSAGTASYNLPGVHSFPQEWSEAVGQTMEDDIDKAKAMEEDLLSIQKGDVLKQQKRYEEKCVGRYDLLELEEDERKFQMIDESGPSQNIVVELPVVKEHDRKLIIDPSIDAAGNKEGKEKDVISRKLALLINVFKRVDEVGGPHKLTKEDRQHFKKKLAVHMPKTDDTEIELKIDDSSAEKNDEDLIAGRLLGSGEETMKENILNVESDIYKAISGIVEEICRTALQDVD